MDGVISSCEEEGHDQPWLICRRYQEERGTPERRERDNARVYLLCLHTGGLEGEGL